MPGPTRPRPRRTRTLVAAAVVAVGLAACSPGGGGDGGFGVERIEEGPVGPEGIVQHLLAAPEVVAELPAAGPAVFVELRHPQEFARHHAFVAVAPDGATAPSAPRNGALLLVRDGATLTVDADASVVDLAAGATLEGDVVAALDAELAAPRPCPAPCEVVGPALVAADGWLPGIGVQGGWIALVPAPDVPEG